MPAAVLDKYKAAATVVNTVLEAIKVKAVEGANLLELCAEGDKLLEAGTAALYNKVKNMPKGKRFLHPPDAHWRSSYNRPGEIWSLKSVRWGAGRVLLVCQYRAQF